MTRFEITSTQVIAILLSSACAFPAFAQATDASTSVAQAVSQPADGTIADIVVTAQKREQRFQDVPMALSVLGSEQMAQRGIRQLDDIASSVPALTITRTEWNAPVVTLRGVGFYDNSVASSPAVSLYTDEIPVAFLAESTGILFDMERTEVLKGPQGTLFGQNSTGGAINFITAKPTDTLRGGFDVSFGRFSALDLNGFVSGPITSTLTARLAVQSQQFGAWQRSESRGDHLGDRNLTAARATFDWRPTDRLNATLVLSGWTDKSESLAPKYIFRRPFNAALPGNPDANYPFSGPSNRAVDWDPARNFKHDDRRLAGSLRIDYDLGVVSLTSISSLSDFKYDYYIEQDGTPFENSGNDSTGDTRSFYQELRLNGTFGPATVVVGGNYEKSRAFQSLNANLLDSTATGLLGPGYVFADNTIQDEHRIETKAVFGNVELDIGSGFIVNGGLRYTRSTRDYEYCAVAGDVAGGWDALRDIFRSLGGLPPGPASSVNSCISFGPPPGFENGPPVTRQLKEDNVSWRVGLQKKFDRNTMVYITVSRGYKAGTFPFAFALTADAVTPVKQESLLSVEGGFKASPARNLQLNASAFSYDYTDKQIKGILPTFIGPVLALISVPKSRIRGFEADIRWEPVGGLMLSGAGSYVDSKVTRSFINVDAFQNSFDYRGQSLPLSPKWSFDGDAEYHLALSSNYDWYVGVHANHQSGTQALFTDPADPNDAIFSVPARTLVDARLGVRSDRMTYELWGRNIFNERYVTNVFSSVDTINAVTGRPTTYGVRVSAKF
ncbi:MAG: TonB-dependent receptor [Sphingomonadaceae bacterium]